jgi:hypothetical protein
MLRRVGGSVDLQASLGLPAFRDQRGTRLRGLGGDVLRLWLWGPEAGGWQRRGLGRILVWLASWRQRARWRCRSSHALVSKRLLRARAGFLLCAGTRVVALTGVFSQRFVDQVVNGALEVARHLLERFSERVLALESVRALALRFAAHCAMRSRHSQSRRTRCGGDWAHGWNSSMLADPASTTGSIGCRSLLYLGTAHTLGKRSHELIHVLADPRSAACGGFR